jgi:hypothetical protein
VELILHIGAAKAGSTSIQKFLFANRRNLQARGFHLLLSPGGQNNRALASMCIGRDRYVGYYYYKQITTLEEKEAFDRETLENMNSELADASRWAHTVISTSEDFYGGLLEIEELQKLREILLSRFSQIRIILYIRSQVETLSSLYSTFLKNGDVISLEDFIKERCLVDSNVYNFFKGAEMWSEVFGRDNLCLRLFDRDAFDNGDLLQDFSNQLADGLYNSLYVEVDVQNESLSPLGQRLALMVNRQIPAFSEMHGWNKWNRMLIAFISRFFTGQGASLDEETTALVNAMFDQSNKLLHQKYFSTREKLFR